jgi:hypothetical protein
MKEDAVTSPWIRKTFVLSATTLPAVEGRIAQLESAVRRQGGVLVEVRSNEMAEGARPSATLVYELPRAGPFDLAKTVPHDGFGARRGVDPSVRQEGWD